jgi:hypothetical protein
MTKDKVSWGRRLLTFIPYVGLAGVLGFLIQANSDRLEKHNQERLQSCAEDNQHWSNLANLFEIAITQSAQAEGREVDQTTLNYIEALRRNNIVDCEEEFGDF